MKTCLTYLLPAQVFAFLTRAEESSLRFLEEGEDKPAESCVQLVVEDGVEAFLPQSALIDREKELQRLQRQADKLRSLSLRP